MDDGFSLPDALNENVGLIGLAAGSAGLRSLASVRGEIESLKALVAKDADERRMQSFLREKLYQFRQQLNRIAKVESPTQRYVEAMALQEVFQEASIKSSMLGELADKQYLTTLQEDLVAATLSPENEQIASGLISGYVLTQSLDLLLRVQDSVLSLKRKIATMEDDIAAAPAPMALVDTLTGGESKLLQYSFRCSAICALLLALSLLVNFQLNKRVLSIDGSLDFGKALVKHDTYQIVALVNKGTQPISIRRILFPLGFSEANHWTGVIPAGKTQEIQVAFNPPHEGPWGGAIEVFSDATRTELSAPLSGFGLAVEINTSTRSKEITFPPTEPGVVQEGDAVIINNVGRYVYSAKIVCPAGFYLDDHKWEKQFYVQPRSSLTIPVYFRPEKPGSYSGDIDIRPQLGDGEPHRIPVRAEALKSLLQPSSSALK
jgi:hypothetical protein